MTHSGCRVRRSEKLPTRWLRKPTFQALNVPPETPTLNRCTPHSSIGCKHLAFSRQTAYRNSRCRPRRHSRHRVRQRPPTLTGKIYTSLTQTGPRPHGVPSPGRGVQVLFDALVVATVNAVNAPVVDHIRYPISTTICKPELPNRFYSCCTRLRFPG